MTPQTLKHIKKSLFRNNIQTSDYVQLFTDGSNVDEKVASAAPKPQRGPSGPLRDHCSVYTAELQKILFALKQAYQSKERKLFLFFTLAIRFTRARKIKN